MSVSMPKTLDALGYSNNDKPCCANMDMFFNNERFITEDDKYSFKIKWDCAVDNIPDKYPGKEILTNWAKNPAKQNAFLPIVMYHCGKVYKGLLTLIRTRPLLTL